MKLGHGNRFMAHDSGIYNLNYFVQEILQNKNQKLNVILKYALIL